MKRVVYILFLAIACCLEAVADKKFTLVIDAGHGGHDAGAVGSFSKEKDINLATALSCGRYVERNCPDVKVVYTRKKDVFVPLHERANIANRNHADIFISIHTNSLPGGRKARGMETYTMGMRRSDEKLSAAQRENSVIAIEDDYQEHYAGYDPNSPESAIMFEFIHDNNMAQSVELAKYVQQNVCSLANRPNKGVKQDVFLVLRETSMPACLIELGFISTPEEETLLNNSSFIDRVAYGIYVAFVKYKDKSSAIVVPYNESVSQQMVHDETNIPQPSETRTRATQQPRKTMPEAGETPSPAKETADETDSAPVFKVQFMTGTKPLKDGASRLKGLTGTDYYYDGKTVKFTVGAYRTFAEANNKKKEIAAKFPDAFVIAMRNGKRMDLNEARRFTK